MSPNFGPVDAALLALLTIEDLGPIRLRRILAEWEPAAAWQNILGTWAERAQVRSVAGVSTAVIERWRAAAACVDLGHLSARAHGSGVRTISMREPEFPTGVLADADGAAALVLRGPADLCEDGVAIVGTRRPTPAGRQIAARFGRELADAGVPVISGLALGIDGAAHEGALTSKAGAPPVGVVGSGLDVIYPWANRHLWEAVGERGLLVSECGLGAKPHGGRFPSRNRIIAALAKVVVVVESHATGGSLITTRLAHEFGRRVLVVPGSILSSASSGTNGLLRDSPHSVCLGTEDVLTALGWSTPAPELADRRRVPTDEESILLAAMGWDPVNLDRLAERTGRPFGEILVSLMRLEADDWVAREAGRWFQLAAPVTPQ